MAFTHTLNQNWSDGDRSIVSPASFSGDGQQSRNLSVPDLTTDMLMNFSLDVSQIKSIYIKSSKDLTLETNSVPAIGTLTLAANAANDETVTIDTKVYKFQDTLTDVDGNVKIGANASESIDNLIAAEFGVKGNAYLTQTT